MSPAFVRTSPKPEAGLASVRLLAGGFLAALAAWSLVALIPALKIELFARASAWLAGSLQGGGIERVKAGWLLASGPRPAVVTAACSASDYFVLVAALLGAQCVRRGGNVWLAGTVGCIAAAPLAIAVNALRVLTLVQVHRWVIPRFPEAYGPFLHLLTGLLVFLPSLILLNLSLEYYGRFRHSRPC